MRKKQVLVLAVLFFAASVPSNIFASVSINSDFKGTLVVTGPNGEIQVVKEGDSIPEILSGSRLDVTNGIFILSTGAGDSVEISCLGAKSSISGGSSAEVSCSEISGQIKLNLTASSAGTLPPTGAPENLNTSPLGGNLSDPGPVDTRSIETSPSR